MKKRKLFVQVLVSGLLLDSAIFSTFAAESGEVTPSGKTIKADSAAKSKLTKSAAKKVTATSTEAPGPKGDTIEEKLQVLADQKAKLNPSHKHEKVELSDELIQSLELSNSGRFVGYGEDGGHTRRRFFGTLAISGSRQPTEHQYRQLFEEIAVDNGFGQGESTILVVDLRGEAHGFVPHQFKEDFAKESEAVTFEAHKGDKELELTYEQEQDIIDKMVKIGQQYTVSPNSATKAHEAMLSHEYEVIKPFKFKASDGGLETEEQLVKRVAETIVFPSLENPEEPKKGLNIEYVRIPIPDLSVPRVEHAIAIIKAIREAEAKHPGGVWVHFHCHAGIGRTSFGLFLATMLRSNYSLDKIAKMHSDAGGRNLIDPDHPEVDQKGSDAKLIAQNMKDIYLVMHPEARLQLDPNPIPSVTTFDELRWH